MRSTLLVALAVVLVLAGCAGVPVDPGTTNVTDRTTADLTSTDATAVDATTTTVAGGSTTTTSATDGPTTAETTTSTRTTTTARPESYDVPVDGGTLPLDQGQVYARVLRVTGKRTPPPSRITLYRDPDAGEPYVSDGFARTAFGLENETKPNVSAPRASGVVLNVAGESGDDATLELRFVLAHEFAHNVQFGTIQDTVVWDRLFDADDHDTERASQALVEGGASYVAVAYLDRYANRSRSRIREVAGSYRGEPMDQKYVGAPYYFGRRYLAARTSSPADHWSAYDDPPNTTEQLLHPGRTDEPRPLSVSTNRSVESRDRRGELFVRLTLTSELPEERAATAAAGWGNDRLLELACPDGSCYAWTIRFDDAANASEFESAVDDYLAKRGTASGNVTVDGDTAFRVRRVSEETVVLLVGPRSWTTATTASGGNETVRIGRSSDAAGGRAC